MIFHTLRNIKKSFIIYHVIYAALLRLQIIWDWNVFISYHKTFTSGLRNNNRTAFKEYQLCKSYLLQKRALVQGRRTPNMTQSSKCFAKHGPILVEGDNTKGNKLRSTQTAITTWRLHRIIIKQLLNWTRMNKGS